ncbi:MAG: DUF2142 domain-containing protein, partial [Solirubrobacteraceae bacterium]|nr:DUF2142 domain-containing protein [Solirubrobacteraceae bacterium]
LILLGGRLLGGGALDRRALVLLGLVGTLWGAAYAVTTPPFESPDEITHLRYAQLIVDQHALPQTTLGAPSAPPDWGVAAADTRAVVLPFAPWLRPPWSAAEDRSMDRRIAGQPRVRLTDSFDTASSQPPAYYGVVAAAQAITRGSILDRLLIGRLVSALLFGFAITGIAAFVRAAVPSAGGAGVVGVAMVACLPLTGFFAGSLNPDALMTATAAWAFALTATVLRRGLSWRRAIALGGVVGLGVLSKITFTALLPMFVVAALVVLVRSFRERRRTPVDADVDPGPGVGRTALMLAASAAVAVAIAAPYVLWAVLSGRGLVFGPPGGVAPALGIRQTITYTVGLFLGEVGPIQERLARSGPIDILGDGLVGRLGWLDYGFPREPMLRILNAWELLAAAALFGIARSARARRAIPVDALVYAVGVAGLMLVIGRAGLSWTLLGLGEFEQARYLFPVAAVGAGGVALALRQVPAGRPRTWIASGVLVAVCVHGVMGYLLTIGRYFA